jgi:hypothetical protein
MMYKQPNVDLGLSAIKLLCVLTTLCPGACPALFDDYLNALYMIDGFYRFQRAKVQGPL